METVAICCRGKSLKSIDRLPHIDTFILVNEFTDELNIPGVKQALNDTPITHMFNWWNYTHIIPGMISNNFYTEYNVSSIISPYTKEVGRGLYSIQGRSGLIPCSYYPDELKPYMWYNDNSTYKWDFPSCGNGAILYGAALARKEVHIIGLDFFQQGVHGYASGAETTPGHDGNIMKKFLIEQVFEVFVDINFYLYTCADVKDVPSNVKVITVEQ